jgi:hypothetical protein
MGFFSRLAAASRRAQAAQRRKEAARRRVQVALVRAQASVAREAAKTEAKRVRQVVQGRVPERITEGVPDCEVPACGQRAVYLVSGRGAAKVSMCARHTEMAP